MVFYIIGLGLGDEQDITIKGLNAVKSSEKVFLEAYTSILGVKKDNLEKFYDKVNFLHQEIIECDREACEEGIDEILEEVSQFPEKNYSFLVVGDPFCATTHSDLFLRAVQKKINVQVIHNASIMNAIGCSGLQVYRFGEAVSICFFTEKWRPYSFYDKILVNRQNNQHTLLLLDIRVKEKTPEALFKNKKIYEPPRFMNNQVCIEQMLEAEDVMKKNAYNKNTKCFALSRIGFSNQKIKSGTLEQILNEDMGEPLHSLLLCADELHCIEQEMYDFYSQ